MKTVKQTTLSRRNFLKWGLASAVGASGMLPSIGSLAALGRLADGAEDDYRALVCIYLFGGADSFNLLIPRDARYAEYAAARGRMAIPAGQLLPVSDAGGEYGFHPAAVELQSLYQSGRLAVVANTGPLLAPTSRADFLQGNVPLPPHLFSHSDQTQQWMTARPENVTRTGWAGRMADLLYSPDDGLSMNLSLAGSNYWQTGETTLPYVLGEQGAEVQDELWDWGHNLWMRYNQDRLIDAGELSSHKLISEYAGRRRRALDLSEQFNAALENSTPLQSGFPENNPLATQLHTVARTLAARVSRQ